MLCAVACGDVNIDDEVKNGTDVDVFDTMYGFIERDEFTPNKENPLEGTTTDMTLEVGTTYYLIITFTITPRQDNDGESYFHTTARFDNIDVLDAKIKEASTSATTNELEHNMEKDAYERNIKASFKVSPSVEDTRKYTMIVRMIPNKANEDGVQLKIYFSLDGNYIVRGDGSDGYTCLIEKIIKGTIATPEIEFDPSTWAIKWKHVKNASYYVVYDRDDNPIFFENKNGEKSEKIIVTPDVKDGADMQAILDKAYLNGVLLSGSRDLKVKAFGEDEKFFSSGYSDFEEVTLNRG